MNAEDASHGSVSINSARQLVGLTGFWLQVAACMNAVRQYPDGFACQYPCDYSQWRDDVIYPVRGPLVSTGTTGAQELDA